MEANLVAESSKRRCQAMMGVRRTRVHLDIDETILSATAVIWYSNLRSLSCKVLARSSNVNVTVYWSIVHRRSLAKSNATSS